MLTASVLKTIWDVPPTMNVLVDKSVLEVPVKTAQHLRNATQDKPVIVWGVAKRMPPEAAIQQHRKQLWVKGVQRVLHAQVALPA